MRGAPIVLLALAVASPARSEETTTQAVNPDWSRCQSEHAPDAPGFGKRVALTFDDGPSVKFTPRVLKVLRKHRVPATFFVVGHRMRSKRAKGLLREMIRDPLFELGNHSYSHPRLGEQEPKDAAAEIDRVTRQLRALGAKPRFFRFPYADSSCETTKMVRARGYAVAGWHVDSADWCFKRGPCKAGVWSEVPDEYRDDMLGLIRARLAKTDGGVVLLHDIHARTVSRLERLIVRLKKDGYRFVHLGDREVFPRLIAEAGN